MESKIHYNCSIVLLQIDKINIKRYLIDLIDYKANISIKKLRDNDIE
jgi:hypothetical protein